MVPKEVAVGGLGRLEAIELRTMLGSSGAVSESVSLAPDRQGDQAILNVVIQYTPYVLGVLGLWLLRHRDKKDFRRTLRVVEKDGSVREETVSYHDLSVKPPDEVVVKALAKLFTLNSDDVRAQIQQAEASTDASGR